MVCFSFAPVMANVKKVRDILLGRSFSQVRNVTQFLRCLQSNCSLDDDAASEHLSL